MAPDGFYCPVVSVSKHSQIYPMKNASSRMKWNEIERDLS